MGFLFLVLYPLRPPPPPRVLPSSSLTRSFTHSLTYLLTHLLTHSHTHSLTHSLAHSLTHSFTHSLTHSLTHSVSQSVHCQGVGCTPWRPLGLRLFCVAGVGQCALPRGRMYALASLGSPPLLRGRRGTMCTAKGSDVRPGVPWVSASFAWKAWDNVHCQGGRMYALASLGSPPLLRGRRGTMCTAKGSDVRPGVPWVSASFAWQAWDNVHCQGVGCTPWRPLGLRLFCVAGVCAAKGSDVRPGVPWVSASFAWQAWHNVHCRPPQLTVILLDQQLNQLLNHQQLVHHGLIYRKAHPLSWRAIGRQQLENMWTNLPQREALQKGKSWKSQLQRARAVGLQKMVPGVGQMLSTYHLWNWVVARHKAISNTCQMAQMALSDW